MSARKPQLSIYPAMLWVSLLSWPQAASAHETPIALLQLREVSTGTFVERWTYSSSVTPDVPTPVFPAHCVRDLPRVLCGERGLSGRLTIEGLGERYSAAVVRVKRLGKTTQTFTLSAAQPVVTLTPDGKLPIGQVAASYIPLGLEHILLGIDHLLFVAGLMLLVSTAWMLFKTITAFTVAHSLTLAAVTFGWMGIPERPVNAAIALSIVFVAVEVTKHRRGQRTLSVRYPWAVAFGFGLLHGMGFAGALTQIGLPAENLLSALLFFNVGVELGQVGFVLLVLALLAAHRPLQTRFPTWSKPAVVYAMGSVASFWFLGRAFVLLSPAL